MKRLDRANSQAAARVLSLWWRHGKERFALARIFTRGLSTVRRWASELLPNWVANLDVTTDLAQETLQVHLRRSVLDRIREHERAHSTRGAARSAGVEVANGVEPVPLEALIGAQAATHYCAALGRIVAAEREAVVARLELGYNYEQIALILDQPSATAARAAVARSLGHLAMEMDRET